MSQNPFDALGGGGLDMNALLEQAQQMQQRLQETQADLAQRAVAGSAGAVTVEDNGLGELTSVVVAPGQFDGSSEEDLADLGDLVVAAFRDAKGKAETLAAQALGPLAGSLGGGGLGGLMGGSPGV